MTEYIGTIFQGPNIINTGEPIFELPTEKRRLASRRQAADELRSLYQRFVQPPGFDQARRILHKDRTVFLEGAEGSGRQTAARMLLWELHRGEDPLHELVLQDPAEGRRFDLTGIGDGDHVLLDGARENEETWAGIRAELSDLRTSIRERGAHLVVILPSRVESLGGGLDAFRALLGPPPLYAVYRINLRVHEFDLSDPGTDKPLPDDIQTPQRAADFVRLIARARNFAAGSGNFSDWRSAAHDSSAGRQGEVAELVRRLEHGGQRALLLATAMLHGAHAHRVHEASSRLLALAKQPEDEKPLLEQPTLGTRLHEIEASLDDRERVQFDMLDYDSAVRTFFWTHLPDLRLPIREWLEQTAGAPELEEHEREELAERIVQQCTGPRHRDMLADLVECWTAPGKPAGHARAAKAVLVKGLGNRKTARFLRGRIYEWSLRRGLPPQLGALLVMVCRDEIAITHPDEAIVRLHHLARRESGASRARDALLWLVEQDPRALRQMLRRLTDPNMKRWDLDRALFLVVAEPRKLTVPGPSRPPVLVSAPVRVQLVIGWREAFELSSPNVWSSCAQDWIGHAASDKRLGSTLIDVLVVAGADQMAVLARLYAMARRRELDADVADSLLHKINKIQGFLVDDM